MKNGRGVRMSRSRALCTITKLGHLGVKKVHLILGDAAPKDVIRAKNVLCVKRTPARSSAPQSAVPQLMREPEHRTTQAHTAERTSEVSCCMSGLARPSSTLRQSPPSSFRQVSLGTDEIVGRSCLRAAPVGCSHGPDKPSPTVTLKAAASSSSEGTSPCIECGLSVPDLTSAASGPGGTTGGAMFV